MSKIILEEMGLFDEAHEEHGQLVTTPLTLREVTNGVLEKTLVAKLRGGSGLYPSTVEFRSPGEAPQVQSAGGVSLSADRPTFLIANIEIPNPCPGVHTVTLRVAGQDLGGFQVVI